MSTASAPRRPISRAPVIITAGFFVVALTLVLIGAQLSAQTPPPPPVGTPGTPQSPRPVTVIMRDYLFDPRPIVLIPGETVRFTIIDAGLEPHEFMLGNPEQQQAWDTADAAATPPAPFASPPPASVPPGTGGLRVLLQQGQQVTLDYQIPIDPSLQLLCHLPGHIAKGMIGQLDLVSSGSASPSAR